MSEDDGAQPAPVATRRAGALRFAYLLAGFAFLALGIIGAFLPLLPTTIFIILAAGCFARSSERLENWLLNHRRFGPTIRAWRAEGAISRRGKMLASSGMVLGYVLFLIGARPGLPLGLFVLAFFAACAWFVLSRPEPSGE
jgi:uncharacterized membrane protein YbaN (DUF454 family)